MALLDHAREKIHRSIMANSFLTQTLIDDFARDGVVIDQEPF